MDKLLPIAGILAVASAGYLSRRSNDRASAENREEVTRLIDSSMRRESPEGQFAREAKDFLRIVRNRSGGTNGLGSAPPTDQLLFCEWAHNEFPDGSMVVLTEEVENLKPGTIARVSHGGCVNGVWYALQLEPHKRAKVDVFIDVSWVPLKRTFTIVKGGMSGFGY